MVFSRHSSTHQSHQTKLYHIVSLGVFLGLLITLGVTFGIKGGVARAACTAPSPSYGTDTMSVNVPQNGTYYVYVRMQTPVATSDEILMNLSNGVSFDQCYTVGGNTSMSLNTWDWINYQGGSTSNIMTAQNLTAGTYTIELYGSEPGVEIDRVLLLTDNTCPVTGTGDSCAPSSVAAPTVSFTSPADKATVSGTTTISADAASAPGVTQVGIDNVKFEVDGQLLATVTTGNAYQTSWNTTSLTNGSSHTLSVIATDTQGQSTTATETVTVNNPISCTAAPMQPSNPTATATGPTSLQLSWGASTPGAGCTLSGYTVMRAGSVVASVGATTTTTTITGLNPSTTYSGFTVVASDTLQHTATSVSFNGTTSADTTPNPPTNVTGTALSSTAIELNWTTGTDQVGIASYDIYRNGVFLTGTTTNATTFTDNGVAAGNTYTYEVSSVNVSGMVSSQASSGPITTPTPVGTAAPTIPTGLTAPLITASSVSLSWNASTEVGGTIAYKVYRGTTAASITSSSSPIATVTIGTSYTDQSLNSSTNYVYEIVAYDTSTNKISNFSSPLSVTTEASTTPVTCSPVLGSPSGKVDFNSAIVVFSHWGLTPATCAQGDINLDKIVNFNDAIILFSNWGQS